jgi:hypothetical protein
LPLTATFIIGEIGTFGLLTKKIRKFFPAVATSAKKGEKEGRKGRKQGEGQIGQ